MKKKINIKRIFLIMIIEKVYSSDNSSMCESDLEQIRTIMEKYESHEVLDAINEFKIDKLDKKYSEPWHGYSSGFNNTGGADAHGLIGTLKAIPSFALTAAIFGPTVTALVGLTALSHRIRQRWEDKKSWRNMLFPGWWIERIANPHKRYSHAHRAVAFTGNAAKAAGAALVGAVFGKKAVEELKNGSAKKWVKKIFAIGAAGAAAEAAAANGKDGSSILNNKKLRLSPEEVKNIAFRDWWIKLSNGEVYKVKADSKQSVKKLVNGIIIIGTMKNGYYNKINESIKNNNYKKFTFYLSDGEVCYSGGKTEEEAASYAKKFRNDIIEALNQSDGDLMEIEAMDMPETGKGVPSPDGELIEVPEYDKMTIQETPFKVASPSSEKPKFPVYDYNGQKDFKVKFGELQMHFPGSRLDNVKDLMTDLVNDPDWKKAYDDYEREATNTSNRQFRVRFNDGDIYRMYSNNEAQSISLAIHLHNSKLMILRKNLYPFNKIFTEFWNKYNNYISEKPEIKEYQSSRYKNYTKPADATIKPIYNKNDDDNDNGFQQLKLIIP